MAAWHGRHAGSDKVTAPVTAERAAPGMTTPFSAVEMRWRFRRSRRAMLRGYSRSRYEHNRTTADCLASGNPECLRGIRPGDVSGIRPDLLERQVTELDRVGHITQAVVAEFPKQALLQAHALISLELSHVDAYAQAAKQTREDTKRLLALTEGDDRELAVQIDALTARIDDVVGGQFRSVVASGDRDRSRELAARSERLVDDVVQISEHLDRSFTRRREAAIARATRVRDQTIWLVTACLLLALVLSAVVGVLITRSIVRPVGALWLGAKSIASGDLEARVEVRGGGELAELAVMFNQMTESLQRNQDALLRSQRLAAVGQLAAAVAHEINNPLSVILGYAKMLRRTPDRVDAEKLQAVEEEALQC